MQGRLDRARELLDDALARSLEAHSTVSVTLCMIAFARLAFAEGDPDRAALLAGAAEGLRRRLGLRAWPMLRQGETELISQIRQAAGPDRFSKMTQAGSRLGRQEAVDAIWHQRGTDTGNPAAGTKPDRSERTIYGATDRQGGPRQGAVTPTTKETSHHAERT